MAFCKNCGTQIPDVARFCPKCGMATAQASVKQPEQAVETVQPPAPPIQPLQKPEQPAAQPVQQPVQQPTQPVQQSAQYAQSQPQQPVRYAQPQQPQQQQQPQQPKPPKKPVNFTWFNDHFMLLFVIGGAVAYLLIEVAALYLSVSTAFTVVLAVFALLFACGFLAVAIIRIIASFKESAEDRKKHSLRDKICFAVSIIIFVFVLLSAIALFINVSNVNDANDAINNLGGMFGDMFN